MNLVEMLDKAAEIKGSKRKLAECLGITEQNLFGARKGIRGIPDDACAKLAWILDLEFGDVIATRNAWTAKTEEEKEFWSPFVQNLMTKLEKLQPEKETAHIGAESNWRRGRDSNPR